MLAFLAEGYGQLHIFLFLSQCVSVDYRGKGSEAKDKQV